MFSWMTWRTYIVIAIIVAILLFLAGSVDSVSNGLVGLVADFRNRAVGSGAFSAGLGDLILNLWRLAFDGNIFVCLIIGALWPLALLWIILIFIMAVIGLIIPNVQSGRCVIDGVPANCP